MGKKVSAFMSKHHYDFENETRKKEKRMLQYSYGTTRKGLRPVAWTTGIYDPPTKLYSTYNQPHVL